MKTVVNPGLRVDSEMKSEAQYLHVKSYLYSVCNREDGAICIGSNHRKDCFPSSTSIFPLYLRPLPFPPPPTKYKYYSVLTRLPLKPTCYLPRIINLDYCANY